MRDYSLRDYSIQDYSMQSYSLQNCAIQSVAGIWFSPPRRLTSTSIGPGRIAIAARLPR